MSWLYNLSIYVYRILILIASYFNKKAKLLNQGQKEVFSLIAQKSEELQNSIWFHFASLGEFEQGRPVLEKIKSEYPNEKITITFFSPSGYEIRKNYTQADGIFYLPLDTPSNAKKFINLINPKMAIFTKYEFWPNYFLNLKKQNIPLYLISGIFRPNQIFFKWYGTFYRKILKCITFAFVQNKESILLLQTIDYNNAILCGDTRFDSVFKNTQLSKEFPCIKQFCAENQILVAGSTWHEDEELLKELVKKYPEWKIIIAPHEIHSSHIIEIEKLFPNSIKYSTLNNNKNILKTINPQALIIDNIGMLSSLYQYGKIAYIGGGFGAGIHNTLEAAAFGLPVIFGPNYEKFQEAKDLVRIGGAKSISNANELLQSFEYYIKNESSTIVKNYVLKKKGATDLIFTQIEKNIRS